MHGDVRHIPLEGYGENLPAFLAPYQIKLCFLAKPLLALNYSADSLDFSQNIREWRKFCQFTSNDLTAASSYFMSATLCCLF